MGSLDAYVPNARADNSITYLGSYKGFTLGAGYSFGRDAAGTGNSPGQGTCTGSVPGHATECRDWSAMLKYDSQYFGAAASYEEQRGGATAAANFFDGIAPTPLINAADKDARTQLSAYAQYAGAKIGAGWIGRRVVTQSPTVPNIRSNLFFLGASYMSFIRGIGSSLADETIIGAIIALARNLRFEVVAEGVERAEQLAFLAEAGCEIVQGYYFAAPQPAANIPAYAASLMSELRSGSS